MQQIFSTLILFHIVAGSIGLVSFWLPVFARKRKGLHTRAGKVFAYSMLVTGATAGCAALLTLAAPLVTHPEVSARYAGNLRAFNGLMLLYLAVITFGAAFSGLRAVQLKRAYGGHRERVELAIQGLGFVLGVVVLILGWRMGSMVMMGLSLVGILGCPGNIRLLLWKPESPLEWKYQHMGSMLGAGIAAHTAFLVFGAGRLIDVALTSSPLVWLAPTLIGVPATVIWKRYYQRQEKRSRPALAATGLEVNS
jgi:hypothetical protein